MIDIILTALLVFGVLLAVLNIIKKRKFGGCCGGCSGCSFDCDCNMSKKDCDLKNCNCKKS